MEKFKLIDLFSGAGGLSEGLSSVGFESLYANEINKIYAKTYAANHKGSIVDARDIRNVDASEIRRTLCLKKGDLDLLAGGPPCQGFSINAPKRDSTDFRNHLFRDFIRFVDEFAPKAVLIENVPGLVSFEGGATLHEILVELKNHEYDADVKILYAPHYGVPQTRWRTIIVGMRASRNNVFEFPNPLHIAPIRVNFTSHFKGKNIVELTSNIELPQHVNVRDAIGDLPTLFNGELGEELKPYRCEAQNDFQRLLRKGSLGVTNHQAPRLSKINLDRLAFVPVGGNWTNIPDALLPKGMQKARKSDHTKRYGRIDPEGLASTILTKCDPHWGAYFHYEQDRTFTVREAARLQTFPDTFQFLGARVEQYEQVGNAVPPFLAAAVGRCIISAITSEQNKLKSAI